MNKSRGNMTIKATSNNEMSSGDKYNPSFNQHNSIKGSNSYKNGNSMNLKGRAYSAGRLNYLRPA